MSSFLCFVCHSTVNSDTNEDIREKYKEVVGMQLCVDSPLCHICCHVLRKLWLFRAVCLKRSLEYPVLFSEKGTLNLQRTAAEVHSACPEQTCQHFRNRDLNSGTFYMVYEHTESGLSDEYCTLQDDKEFEGFKQVDNAKDFHNDDVNEHKYNDYNNHDLEQSLPPEEYCDFEHDDNNDDTNNHNYEEDNPDIDNHNHNFDNENHDFYTENQNHEIDTNNEIIEEINQDNNNFETKLETNDIETNDIETNTSTETKKKSAEHKKKSFKKIVLSVEEQKQELERRRKEKKYLEAEFKCHSCALSFLFKDTYQTHMMRHEESNGEYVCSICSLRFASSSVLRAHTLCHSVRYTCRTCGGGVRARGRGGHRASCWGEGGGRTCHLCGRSFRDGSGLQQHLNRFHSISHKRYKCGSCPHHTARPAALRTHMIKHLTRKFPCPECGAELSSPYSLATHLKKHNQLNDTLHYCTTCDKSFSSKKGLRAHLNNTAAHRRTVIECNICGRHFSNARSLSAHTNIHTHTQQYTCTYTNCHKQYSTRKALRRHMNTHTQTQTQEKTAFCHYCGAGFKGNNKLNRHLREVCEKNRAEEELTRLYENSLLQHPG